MICRMLRRIRGFLPRSRVEIAAQKAPLGVDPPLLRREMRDRGYIRLNKEEFTTIRGVLGAIEHDHKAALLRREGWDEELRESQKGSEEAIRSDLALAQSAQRALFEAEGRG